MSQKIPHQLGIITTRVLARSTSRYLSIALLQLLRSRNGSKADNLDRKFTTVAKQFVLFDFYEPMRDSSGYVKK
jgi:hypothetical protein